MPYYIGDVIRDYKRLVVRTPEEFGKTGIEVRIKTRVDGIDPGKGAVYLSDGTSLPYDILVMGTGGLAIRPGIPGENLEGVFTLRNLTDSLRIKSYLNEKSCRRAIIVGGGYISMEMSEALRNLGIETRVIHRRSLPVRRWDPELSKMIVEELTKNGVSFHPETRATAIEKGENFRLRMTTTSGEMDADLILYGLGSVPNVDLAKSMGLQMGESGAIRVDSSQRTTLEGVYAVGDCCEVFHLVSKRWTYSPLGDVANKQGRIAGQNIAGHPAVFPGIVGAQCFKVFGLEVGITGLTDEEAKQAGFQPVSTIIWGNPVARSMSRGERLGIRLTAEKSSGKLLGAQAIGDKGAVQRINSLSVALWCGLDIDQIGYMDLAYAPPFGGAWDAIHIAAQNLRNKL
jgi:NADPH-dependent 2,4-dienoyl-CoA reductase/sulfur reductase-like enzyme